MKEHKNSGEMLLDHLRLMLERRLQKCFTPVFLRKPDFVIHCMDKQTFHFLANS